MLTEYDILSAVRRYPLSRPTDLRKLAFQEAMGPGHLVASEEGAIARCLAEAETLSVPGAAPAVEPLGSDYCRVSLYGLGKEKLALLGTLFYRSAVPTGEKERNALAGSLGLIRALAGKGMLPFSEAEWDADTEKWTAAGEGAVSHSAEYREAYRPAYRVIGRRLLPLLFPDL